MPLKSVICTVFQGRYHFGVGALVNSLYKMGYRGVIYAAYKGELPPWANHINLDATKCGTLHVAEGLEIFFAYQRSPEMLANIKPDVIDQVWARYHGRVENVFYFDCDITVKARWQHFEEWARHGVALVEDMNSPVFKTNLLRLQWKEYFRKFDIQYEPRDEIYVNGGFVGLNERFRSFTETWETIQKYMKLHTGQQDKIGIADRWNLFHFMDQDALNVAKDLTPTLTIFGKGAMDFSKFGYVMSHAAGPRKPWDINYLKYLLVKGGRPTYAEKQFWLNANGVIKLYPNITVFRKKVAIKIAVLLGRFFTRV